MDRENGVLSVDAAEVGLALAFPGGLHTYIEGLTGEAAPVEQAVAAAWARMDSLRVVTAELNESVARPRVIGLSRGRRALEGGGAPEWVRPVRPFGTESALGVDRPRAPADLEDVTGIGQAATEVGRGDGSGVNGSVAPIVIRDAGDGQGSGGMLEQGVPVAPSSANMVGQREAADEVGWAQRSIAPVKVRVIRGAAGGGDGGRGGRVALPDDAMGAVPGAVAPPGSGGRAYGAEMRADVASALRSRGTLLAAPGGDEATGGAPGPQEPPRAAAGGAMTRLQSASEAGGEALSGEVTAPLPQGRNGGAGGGDIVLGNIMLDGHPVGTWMGSRMARDAARPGAGATSFDPRQAPAWTPSGAL